MSEMQITKSDALAPPGADATPLAAPAPEATRLRDLTPHQWRSGIAAWLGWLFDGLDMHLYTLVAGVFVAQLLGQPNPKHPDVDFYSSWIQAAFLFGWALGGGFFGRFGDWLGRSKALVLTILTYALFTGLSFFAQTWWQLFIFRFLAALGIGGEWSVGASLLSETWPKKWRPWLAAVLQTGVNIGILFACVGVSIMTYFMLPERCVFLIGVLPAFIVLWIRRAVPETAEWHAARNQAGHSTPSVLELFRGPVRRITLLTLLVCALCLTPHWAFTFWCWPHLRNLPDLADWSDSQKQQLVNWAFFGLMVAAIAGNFLGGWIATRIGYRKAIALLCFGYFASMLATYSVERSYVTLLLWFIPLGMCQGIFALFTMYMPPLFPTLLRTTGAGFSYNIGRIAAALGTVFFGVMPILYPELGFAAGEDRLRLTLLYSGCLFLPAGLVALALPEHEPDKPVMGPTE